MNNAFLFYANQMPCTIPTAVQSDLREKIKDSDLLVADDKGIHRLIGLKYREEIVNAPVVTCVCMRHEMALAKQIAFETGKRIFYDSNVSAGLFDYQRGEVICPMELLEPLAKMFAKELCSKRKIRKEEIYIPAHFKLSYLTGLLGKPDFINDYSINKVYKWENYGLEAESFSLSKGYVFRLTVKIHKTKYSSLSLNIAGIFHLNNKEIKPWDAGRKIKKNSIYSIFIRSLDNNQEYTCKKSEIQTIQVIFTLSPNKLLDAVYRADKHEIISLLKRGRDINRRSTGYCSPLMAAMRFGNLEIAKLLLENGADPNIQDEYGNTLLHSAVSDENIEEVKLLIKYGADMNKKNSRGFTPLMRAVRYKERLSIAHYLIESGCDISIKNCYGETAFDIMKKVGLLSAFENM